MTTQNIPLDEIYVWKQRSTPMTIQDVLPHWGRWTDEEEQELMLTKHEYEQYSNKQLGMDKRILTSADTCPTILHSYSVALGPCPCGCRSRGFDQATLQAKGLRGCCIQSPASHQPRFMHPTELAVLLTIPASMRMVGSCRAANCLLGLVSAPLQSLWVFSHLVKAASRTDASLAHIQPEQILETYRRELLQQAREHVDYMPLAKQTLEIFTQDGSSIVLCAPQTATVMQFLTAETITLEWGHSQNLAEGPFCLPEHYPLALTTSPEVFLTRQAKRHRKACPTGTVVLCLVHHGECLIEFLSLPEPLALRLWRSLACHRSSG